MKKRKMKRGLVFALVAVMALSVSSAMAFAANENTAPHKYVAGDWTTAGGYGSVEAVAGDDNAMLIKGGELNSDGYPTGPFSKAALENFSEEKTTLTQELNVFMDPKAHVNGKVDNGYLFVISSALNDEGGAYTAEGSFGLQKSGDAIVVDGHGITITEKDVYTFRVDTTKKADGVYQKMTVLKRGEVVGSTDEIKLTQTAGEPAGQRYLWLSSLNAVDGIKVYTEVPAYTITLNVHEWAVEAGNKYQLEAAVGPEFIDDKTVTWESSNEEIVTVDEKGVVTAVAKGTATVTATYNGASDECVFTVNEKSAAGTDEGTTDGTASGGGDKNSDVSPKTGDDTNMMLPVLLAAAAAVAGVAIVRRKRA